MNIAAFRPFINPSFRYALVGATTNRAKYGYTVLKDLAGAGFRIVGINPHYSEIEGTPVFPSLAALPNRPDVAVFVVPPVVGLTLLDEVKRLGIPRVWFQPGAESEAIQSKITALGLTGQANHACIMVTRQTLGLHGSPIPHHQT